jgi:hypothetical protein
MPVASDSAAASMLIAGAAGGVLVAPVNYFMPDNGISGTPGALLVVGSCALLALAGFAIRRRVAQGRGSGLLLALVALVLVAGTGFAAWLLEAQVLVALMVLAGLGWLALVVRRRGA